MRIEMSRTFPVPREPGYAYVMDPEFWVDWTPIKVVGSKDFTKKGDVVALEYRMLGVPVSGEMKLLGVEPGHHAEVGVHFTGSPLMKMELEFANAGAHAFTLKMVVMADEPENFWETSLRFMSMVVPTVRHELRLMLDRLHLHFVGREEVAA